MKVWIDPPSGWRWGFPRIYDRVEHGDDVLAWLVQQPWVITIPMSHNPVHLQQNWDAAAITLTPEQMARLDGLA